MMVIALYRKKRIEMNARMTNQNQKMRYIFSLMMFWVNTQNPFCTRFPPAGPTSGRLQDISVGKA